MLELARVQMQREAGMKKRLSGVRGTVAMILTWTVGWGLGFGGLMELVDPHGQFGDVWPTALAMPGFLGGILFCGLLRITEGGRDFAEVPLARATIWGGATGLGLAALAISKVAGPISSVISHIALGMATAFGAGSDALRGPVALGILTALGAVAGFGSSAFFRLLARRQPPEVAGRVGQRS
jgi:hypothetical protein